MSKSCNMKKTIDFDMELKKGSLLITCSSYDLLKFIYAGLKDFADDICFKSEEHVEYV